jgi:FAD/FMN-containing dehydrogenase
MHPGSLAGERPVTMPQRPTHSEALAEMIRAASDAAGGGARVVGSNAMPLARVEPGRPVQEISTLRMNKVLEHAEGWVTVQAGISLEALQRQLAWKNQWLPIDPPNPGRGTPGQRTLGGLIATNSLGPLRFRAGEWMTLLMEMTWVDRRGTLTQSTDEHTLRSMIGSCGNSGAIAEVKLRTSPPPLDERCLILFCESVSQAEALLAKLMNAPTTPAYVQAIGGETFSTNPLELPTLRKGVVLVLGFLDAPAVCEAQVEILRTTARTLDVDSISQTAAQSGRLRLWMTTEPPVERWGGGIGFRIETTTAHTCALLSGIEQAARHARHNAWIVSEAGSGIIRGALGGKAAYDLLQRVCGALAPQSQMLITQGFDSLK